MADEKEFPQVRLSRETYSMLVQYQGMMQMENGERITFDESVKDALTRAVKQRKAEEGS